MQQHMGIAQSLFTFGLNAATYPFYDIIIWSATSMRWIEVKMQELGCTSHPDYKLTAYMDHASMVTVHTEK